METLSSENRSILEAFRQRYRDDRQAGEVQSLRKYLDLFDRGHEDIAYEYLALESAARSGSAPTGVATRGPLESLGPYRILQELGRGGQGVVYLAEDSRLGRRLALKVLTALGIATDDALLRFRREAEVASKLDHHGICTIFETGVEDGTAFIAMQLVDGESLARRIATALGSGPGRHSTIIDLTDIAPDEEIPDGQDPSPTPSGPTSRNEVMAAVGLIEKVARAVHAAHEAGIVHRDLKPANIMVTGEGEPVVLDFGLARELEAQGQGLTRSGDLFGTPAYMSPEQLGDDPSAVDGRADVYALAVTLYECLTLRRPFEAPTRQALYQAILGQSPQDPRKINAAIPRDLQIVLQTALEKDPARRYPSALEFAEDLRRVRALEPLRARPVGPFARLWRSARRNPAIAASIAVVIVAAVGALAAGSYFRGVADTERRQKEAAVEKQRAADTAREQAESERDHLRDMLENLQHENEQLVIPSGGTAGAEITLAPPHSRASQVAAIIEGPVTVMLESKSRWAGHAKAAAPLPPPAARRPDDPRLEQALRTIVTQVDVSGEDEPAFQIAVDRELEEIAADLDGGDPRRAAEIYNALGDRLRGEMGMAIPARLAWRRAREIDAASADEDPVGTLVRAQTLRQEGKLDAAADAMQQVVRIFEVRGDPAASATVARNRSNLLIAAGRNEEALSELQAAAAGFERAGDRHNQAMALCSRGLAMVRLGDFVEGRTALREGHRLGSAIAGWEQPSEEWLSFAERCVRLEAELSAYVKEGKLAPDAQQIIALAEMAARKGCNLAAAELCERVLDGPGAAKASLGLPYLRVLGAIAAARASQGFCDRVPSREERAHWRERARAWLAEELATHDAAGPGGAGVPQETRAILKGVSRDPRLGGLRAGPRFSSLPKPEQAAWSELWTRIAAL